MSRQPDEYNDDDDWYIPEVFQSQDHYSELMSRWVDEDAKYEAERAPIPDVEVRISRETNGPWCGRFEWLRDRQSYRFRPRQQVTVARRFPATVTGVTDNDVTVTFQENDKFEAWVEDMGTRVGCEITTEGRTADILIEVYQGIVSGSDVWHASFKVSDDNLRDIKPGGCLTFRSRAKKSNETLTGTVLSLGIDNRVYVRLETGPRDKLEKSRSYNISLAGGMSSEQVQRALTLFGMTEPLFDVSVKVEQRQRAMMGMRWYGTFQGEGDIIRQSRVGDRLFLIEAGKNQNGYMAEVTSRKRNTVEVEFSGEFMGSLENGGIEMDIYPEKCVQDSTTLDPDMVGPSTTTTQEIKDIWLGKEVKRSCSPCKIDDTIGGTSNFYWRARPLSPSQKEAVEVAMGQPLTIIQGPTGTGKTTCVAAYVWNTVKKYPGSKVLVTTPSKSSIDQACDYFVRAGLDVVRIQSRAEAIGPDPSHPNVRASLLREKLKAFLKNTEAVTKVLAEGGFESFQSKKSKNQTRKILGELVKSVNNGTVMRQFPMEYNCLCKHIISRTQVVCCTLSMAGNSLMHGIPFEYVVIDEATRAVEPQALVAVMHGSKQVVLVGDPMQLWPIVNYPNAERYGYGSSIIHRLVYRSQSQQPMLLRTQYRMHPAIAEFPIGFFYNKSIENGVTEARMREECKTFFDWPDSSKPLMVLHTQGDEKDNVNEKEANTIIDILQDSYARKVQSTSIGVILMYNAQKLYIRRTLARRSASDPAFREWCNQLAIDTVDGFQGVERDFILISTVKIEKVGARSILADPKRLNVMLTRARYGMIIVGDIELLSTIVGWQDLIYDAKERDLLWYTNSKNELEKCDRSLISKRDPIGAWKLDEIDDLRWIYDDFDDELDDED